MQLTLLDATEFSQAITTANGCKNSWWQSQPPDSPSRRDGGAGPVRCVHTLLSIISHYTVQQREGFPFSTWQCKGALYSRGCTASFLQDKRPLKKVPTWLLTVYYASSHECGMLTVFPGPCHFNGQLSIVAKHHIGPLRGKRSRLCRILYTWLTGQDLEYGQEGIHSENPS